VGYNPRERASKRPDPEPTVTDNSLENRRRYPRLEQGNKLLLDIVTAPDHPELTGRQFICYTRDGSISGMRIFASEVLPPNCSVDIRLDNAMDVDSQILRLQGVTRWCRPSDEGDFMEVGIEIIDGLEEDTTHWKRLFPSR